MSFESFRADLVSRIGASLPQEQLQAVLDTLDGMASAWEFSPVQNALIEYGTIPDAVRLFIASKSVENLKRDTLELYYAVLRGFFCAVRKPLNQVSASDVRMFLAWYKQKHGIANSTLEHRRITLHGFFEWCVDEDLLRKNPVRQVKPIRCDDPERLPMTALELEKVRNACATLREKALVDFLFSTAARVSEVSDLKISNISLLDHTVHIEHGKGDKGRTTFMNAEAEVSIRAYLDARTDGTDALFVSGRAPHNKMSKKAIEDEIRRICSRCELSVKVTPHVFRHTAASIALQRGMPIDQVQKFLGHARIQTTLRYAKTLDLDVKLSHQRCVS